MAGGTIPRTFPGDEWRPPFFTAFGQFALAAAFCASVPRSLPLRGPSVSGRILPIAESSECFVCPRVQVSVCALSMLAK